MDAHDCLHFLTFRCRSFCPTRQHKASLDVDVPHQSTKRTNPPPSDTLTWTLTRSPLAFWAPRASRTLSLADGLCLGQGAEEQERRARSRHRAPNIARPPQALLGTSPDPSARGPCLREPSLLLPSSGPQPESPRWLPSPSRAPAREKALLSPSPKGRKGHKMFSDERQRESARLELPGHPTTPHSF